MAANQSSEFELIIKMVQRGEGGKLSAEQLDLLKKKAEEVSEAGFKAGEALEKLSGKGRTVQDAVAGGNRGAGLASGDPAAMMRELEQASKGNIQITREQVATYEALEKRLKTNIEVKRLANQEYSKESELLQKVKSALAPYRGEQENTAKVLETLKRNQADSGKETEKSTTAKQKFMEALRGVSAESSTAAQGLRLLAHPLAVVSAAAAAGVGFLRTYISHVSVLTERARELARVGDGLNLTRGLAEQVGADRDRIVEQLQAMGREVDSVTAKYSELAQARMLDRRLAEEMDDAILDNELSKVDVALKNKTITPTEAWKAQQDLMRAARDRKEERELTSTKAERDQTYYSAMRAKREGDQAAGGIQPAEQKLIQLKDEARKLGQDQGKIGKEADAIIASREKDLDLLSEIAEGKGHTDTVLKLIGRLRGPWGLGSAVDWKQFTTIGEENIKSPEMRKLAEEWLKKLKDDIETANRSKEAAFAVAQAKERELAAQHAHVQNLYTIVTQSKSTHETLMAKYKQLAEALDKLTIHYKERAGVRTGAEANRDAVKQAELEEAARKQKEQAIEQFYRDQNRLFKTDPDRAREMIPPPGAENYEWDGGLQKLVPKQPGMTSVEPVSRAVASQTEVVMAIADDISGMTEAYERLARATAELRARAVNDGSLVG